MTIKVGLIGCGGITKRHVDGWNAIASRAEIVAISDISEATAKVRAAQIGKPVKYYKDYHELLQDKAIDAVDISLPHFLHRESIVAAAEAGKHLLSEKPLCLDLEEAAAIADAVKKNGVTMMAMHNQLFMPSIQQAKLMLLNGDLGKIFLVNSYDCGASRGTLSPDKSRWGKAQAWGHQGTWRADPAKMGGGELIDTGYHPTYRLLFLAGQMPTEVAAMLGTYRLGIQGEDTASVLLKFPDGVTGKIFSSWAMSAPSMRALRFQIVGEKGELWGELDKLYYQPIGFQSPAVIEYPGWHIERTAHAAIEHFVSAIEGGFEPLPSVHEATDALRVVLAGYQSVAEKRIVTL